MALIGHDALCFTGEYVLVQDAALKRELLVTLQQEWVRKREKYYHVHLSDLAHIRGEFFSLYAPYPLLDKTMTEVRSFSMEMVPTYPRLF